MVLNSGSDNRLLERQGQQVAAAEITRAVLISDDSADTVTDAGALTALQRQYEAGIATG